VVGIGLVCATLFAADPIGGYPAGTPPLPPRTLIGELPRIASAAVFVGMPGAALTANQNGRSFAIYSAAHVVDRIRLDRRVGRCTPQGRGRELIDTLGRSTSHDVDPRQVSYASGSWASTDRPPSTGTVAPVM
jgi:hypothetical protein